jgi:chaperonin GroES
VKRKRQRAESIITNAAKEKPVQGKVIAIGAGKFDENGKQIPLDVKEGNRVLFIKYTGNEIKIQREKHLIVREEDILGIVK